MSREPARPFSIALGLDTGDILVALAQIATRNRRA
jgi:hypothetical protein